VHEPWALLLEELMFHDDRTPDNIPCRVSTVSPSSRQGYSSVAFLIAGMLPGRLIHAARQLYLRYVVLPLSPRTEGRHSLHLYTHDHIKCNNVLELQLVYIATSPFCTIRSIILLLLTAGWVLKIGGFIFRHVRRISEKDF